MLDALVAGNLDDLAPHFMHIVPLLTSSLKSRVLSERCCDLYLKLRMAVFESDEDVFGELEENNFCFFSKTAIQIV